MFENDQEQAQRDAYNNYKRPFASTEYNRAHDSARVSYAEGAMVGGLIGSIIGLLVMVAVACTVGLAHLLTATYRFLRNLTWEETVRASRLFAKIALAIGVLLSVLVGYVYARQNFWPKSVVERQNLFNDLADRVERSADFANETASVQKRRGDFDVIWAKRRRYVEVLLDRANPAAPSTAWWHEAARSGDDKAFYGRLNQQLCRDDSDCLKAARQWSRASIAMLVNSHSYTGRRE